MPLFGAPIETTLTCFYFVIFYTHYVHIKFRRPLYSLKLIVPKMRHENERVALLALAVLEACVKNCGHMFHQELGKFRFLNEVIKMLSIRRLLGMRVRQYVQCVMDIDSKNHPFLCVSLRCI